MRHVVRILFLAVCSLAFLPQLSVAQEKLPNNTAFKGGEKESTGGAVIRSFFSLDMWWFWLGIIAILGLLGFLYYQRNKSDD